MRGKKSGDDGERGITWPELCRKTAALPGVVQGSSYRTPALFVEKKLLARLKEDGETAAVRVDLADRDVLLHADPDAFFLTDHYVGYPWILVRLARVPRGLLMELLQQAWQRVAPKRLLTSPAERRNQRSKASGVQRKGARGSRGRRRATAGS
jgi:hypothetical protein